MPSSPHSGSGGGERYRLPNTANPSPKTPNKSKSRAPKTPNSGSAKRKSSTPSRRSIRHQQTTSRRPLQPTQRRRRFRPGMKALQEIKKLQRTTHLCIRKLPFSRLVREIQVQQNPRITHWQTQALAALQEGAEGYMIRFLQDCNEAAMFAKRVTVMNRDFQFINRIRGIH